MTDPTSLDDRVHARLRQALLDHAPLAPQIEPHLRGVIAETAANPGKLFRAHLVLATTSAHGIDEDTGLALASAVEFYHAASLLLDDLPCMDDATTRRGRSCAHLVHGEAATILGALALINRAYALVGFALVDQPPAVRLPAQSCLDACLGPAGLVGGQALDLNFAASDRSAREVARIARAKTGTMLWLGLLFPALLARPSRPEIRHLEALCLYWSLAFQGLDDLRDVLATAGDTGKTTRRDRALNRPNLALALGVPRTRARIQRLLRQGNHRVQQLIRLHRGWSYLGEFHAFLSAIAAPLTGDAAVVAA